MAHDKETYITLRPKVRHHHITHMEHWTKGDPPPYTSRSIMINTPDATRLKAGCTFEHSYVGTAPTEPRNNDFAPSGIMLQLHLKNFRGITRCDISAWSKAVLLAVVGQ